VVHPARQRRIRGDADHHPRASHCRAGASAGTPAQSITALVSDGAFFLTFEDGTVVSASVLCPRQAVPGALGNCPANHAYDV
jgi:ketosteroid isomerase-like protein